MLSANVTWGILLAAFHAETYRSAPADIVLPVAFQTVRPCLSGVTAPTINSAVPMESAAIWVSVMVVLAILAAVTARAAISLLVMPPAPMLETAAPDAILAAVTASEANSLLVMPPAPMLETAAPAANLAAVTEPSASPGELNPILRLLAHKGLRCHRANDRDCLGGNGVSLHHEGAS